jgi:phosphoglucosamine mutase
MVVTKLFGTDGIRAHAGEFPLNSPSIVAIGHAIGEKLRGKILVGQDTRLSSPWIYGLLASGIRESGAEIEDAGVIPTPAIALLVKQHEYSGGVMISASHNPYADNGIKVFCSDGTKLSDADEIAVEGRVCELMDEGKADHVDTIPEVRVSAVNRTCWPERYQNALLSHFVEGRWLAGKSVVLDCAHGAMSEIAPAMLTRLGAEVTVIHASPTGKNINAGCGAVHLESLTAAMRTLTVDFGVAFDGDGDRSLFVSNSGRVIDGDAILLMAARRLKRTGRLSPAVVVGTQMTNYSLERMLKEEGIGLTRVSVGDRFIFEEMQRSGSIIGGEPSGHIIFSDFRLSGDGLLTTLKVAEAMVNDYASFDDLTADWIASPQLLENVRVTKKVPLETLPAVQQKMEDLESRLRGRGRLVVRYSGTEPLLRVMIESDDAARNEELMRELLQTIGENLGIKGVEGSRKKS